MFSIVTDNHILVIMATETLPVKGKNNIGLWYL